MTSTAVVRYMERVDIQTTLVHAMRHLLEHVPDRRMSPSIAIQELSNAEAIDILVACHDAVRDDREYRCEWEIGESSYGAGDSLTCGRPADESGFCEKHRGLV